MDSVTVTLDADTLCDRAAVFIQAGRSGVARPLLAAARSLAEPSSRICLLAAQIAIQDGAWQEAIRELDTGIVLTPADAGLRRVRADLRRTCGDNEGAARDAAEAVILDPRNPQGKAILGAALLDLGRAVDAVACLAEAVRAAPEDQIYREALAMALEAAGEPDTALRVLTDGIALAPANVSARNAAILLCIRRRDFLQAERLAEAARRVGIADACTFGLKGHALSSLGRHEDASLAYQDALKLGPDDPYVRHLVVASGAIPGSKRAPEDYVRTVFDGYADRFEPHLISLGYRIPAMIRAILQSHPVIANGQPLGPVLDLGCGTGMVGLAIDDLNLGPITGIDLSPRMLDHARAKQIYADLREADIMTDLANQDRSWPLVIAADVVCYFGALEDLFTAVHGCLAPGGWFIFSAEELLPDHDGVLPGQGGWALERMGRYKHSLDYVCELACGLGFRIRGTERPSIRREAGADVPGMLLTLERIGNDA